MKWSTVTTGSPNEIAARLDKEIILKKNFFLKMKSEEDQAVWFKFRRRIDKGGDHVRKNMVVVYGKIKHCIIENKCLVNISFKLHWMVRFTQVLLIAIGLIALLYGAFYNTSFIVPGLLFILLAFLSCYYLEKRFKRNCCIYKDFLKKHLE